MKIGLITQPFHNNFGGILQAYALQNYLKCKYGATIYIIKPDVNKNLIIKYLRTIRQIFNRTFNQPSYYEYHQDFLSANFKFISTKDANSLLDVVIAGSDQIWRHDTFIQCKGNFFCDFIKRDIIKIAYAASFGLDKWHYNSFQTKKFKKLLLKFKSVSMREESGVLLCKNHFSINANHVVDPTLLLNSNDYRNLYIPTNNKKELLIYWLGNNADLQIIINNIKDKWTYNIIRIENSSYSIEKWISCFIDSKYIITDSYHGCIFSIIFKKEFVVCTNKSGGISRLTSLLKSINLSSRLVSDNISDISILFNSNINYDNVDNLLEKQIKFSKNFIHSSLF